MEPVVDCHAKHLTIRCLTVWKPPPRLNNQAVLVDGRNPKQPPGMVLKPCKYWDKLPTNWCGISSINSSKGQYCFITLYCRIGKNGCRHAVPVFFGQPLPSPEKKKNATYASTFTKHGDRCSKSWHIVWYLVKENGDL